MPGTAVTKSVIANEPGGKRREEIFVDIIEKVSVTFSSNVSASIFTHFCYNSYSESGILCCIIFMYCRRLRI